MILATIWMSAFTGCADPGAPPTGRRSASVDDSPVFDGELGCLPGEEDGAAFWDYGANPKGTIEEPVRWVRTSFVGLDPSLTLTFFEEAGGLDDVVVATNDQGRVIAFVEFGRDDEGRYFPNEAAACASAGIEDFT